MSTFRETSLWDEFEVRDERRPDLWGMTFNRIAGNTADALDFNGKPTGRVEEIEGDIEVHILFQG
jgi:hypothetical protein